MSNIGVRILREPQMLSSLRISATMNDAILMSSHFVIEYGWRSQHRRNPVVSNATGTLR